MATESILFCILPHTRGFSEVQCPGECCGSRGGNAEEGVLALTALTGAALGGEAGFLVGAVTMLASNLLFSQGPWTPWQMLGMGLVGLVAGACFREGALPREKWALALFGAVSALAVYGVLLNISSALLATGTLTWGSVLAYCTSGFPMDCVHAAASFAFLFLFAEPMLATLARVRRKYGFGA